MYRIADIRQVHIEASTRCNAECPMCTRNLNGRTSPGLVEESLSLATFQRALPAELVAQLEVLDICGAYGDPVMAPDLIPICRRVHDLNPGCEIRIFSNGGIRPESWWKELAGLDCVVVFAIDGIETNHVYRRRVDIDKVLRNAKAFIAAGGRAHWDYIVFEHNEHEVGAAEEMSQSLGFERFSIKRTARFLRPLYEPAPELRPGDGIDRHPIYDRDGRVVGELRPPRATQYVNDVLLWVRSIEQRASYLDSFFDSCEIDCLALDSRSIFMSVTGAVYPCCWLYVQATLPDVYGGLASVDESVHDLLMVNGGGAALDATTHDLDEILGGPFFSAIERSWEMPSVAEGRLKVCARVCGKGFEAYRRQFATPDLVP